VLIYSEFAGCADSFKGALVVNPYDTQKVAETVHTALTMGETTKQVFAQVLPRSACELAVCCLCASMRMLMHELVECLAHYSPYIAKVRHHQLSRYVSAYTAARWAKSMISSLGQAVEKVSIVYLYWAFKCDVFNGARQGCSD
jgi:trehalose-6-phosphate synthase